MKIFVFEKPLSLNKSISKNITVGSELVNRKLQARLKVIEVNKEGVMTVAIRAKVGMTALTEAVKNETFRI
jgi:hypothetical protein